MKLYIWLIDRQWNDYYFLSLSFEWFVKHVLAFKHLQQMDVSLGYIIDHLQIIMLSV